MSNLSPTAKELMSVNARMRKLRAELARLVLIERGLVVELKDTEKLTLQKIADLLGVKARQQILAMYKLGKAKA